MGTAGEALRVYRPEGGVGAGRPLELALRTFTHLVREKFIRRRERFPLVTMLEPLEACNLDCFGCGRIREYLPVITKTLTLEQCLKAVEDSGAPIVSIAGGEPTMYKQLPELIEELVRRKIFVYCCTNGLLLERTMKKVPPSKYLAWVIHLDGMEARHDVAVNRKGVWKKAMTASRAGPGTGLQGLLQHDALQGLGRGGPAPAVHPGDRHGFRGGDGLGRVRLRGRAGAGHVPVAEGVDRGLQAGAHGRGDGAHPLLQQPALPPVPAG